MLNFLFVILLLLISGCDDDRQNLSFEDSDDSWVFVANEGKMYDSNGSVSMIDGFGNVYETEFLGDVVQSLAVYNNQLIVSINNSYKIMIFDIDSEGLTNKLEISMDGFSPREIKIINGRAYIGVWNPDPNVYQSVPGHIKVLNLETLEIEQDIEVGIMPEGLMFDSNYLWVANSGESSISKIDVSINSVVETVDVGDGPQNLIQYNGDIYISRTFYNADWDIYHGSSKITDNHQVITKDYGSGVACGGAVLKHDNNVYRSYNGGISPLDENLNIIELDKIGNYAQDEVYHVELVGSNIWFGIRDSPDGEGTIKVINPYSGEELTSYYVGINPGDFAVWHNN